MSGDTKAVRDVLHACADHGQYMGIHPDEAPQPDPRRMILDGHHESALLLLVGDVGEAAIALESEHFRDVLVQACATALAMIEGLDEEARLVAGDGAS